MEKLPVGNDRPRIINQPASPLMFESDEEDSTDEEESTNSNNKENANASTESIAEPTKEQKILKGFQTVLMGIPPPPTFTVPQLNSQEILKLWKDNVQYRDDLSTNKGKEDLIKQVEEEAKTTKWPEVTTLTHWDIYYNRSIVSEDIEALSVRYKERYVGTETASCINSHYTKSPTRTASAKKRMRQQAWGHSPGRRLSHLARRRKAFSSANLCSVAGNSRDKKMVMVEIKKIGNRQTKKNSAKKTKPTPGKKVKSEASTYKRALFQSPDQLPNAKQAQTPNTQQLHRSKRNLFANNSSEKRLNENGKRERPAARRISPRKRVNRSLFFQDSQGLSQECSQTNRQQSQPSLTMSSAHKQKMLWAATNALREEGMGMNHELFRPCMTVLFRTCQKLWLTKVANQVTEGTTSENMLALTRKFSAFTIKEINADPTSEHMAKVCIDIMRMAESALNHGNKQQTSNILSSTKSCPKTAMNAVNTVNDDNNDLKTDGVKNGENIEIKSSNMQEKKFSMKQTPIKVIGTSKSKFGSAKKSQNTVENVTASSEDAIEYPPKIGTPRGKSKLSKVKKLTTTGCSSPSSSSLIAQSDNICNLNSSRLTENVSPHKSKNPDESSQNSKAVLCKSLKKLFKDRNMINAESCSTNENDLSQSSTKTKTKTENVPEYKNSHSCKLGSQSLETASDGKLDDVFEINKENESVDSFKSSQKTVEGEKSGSSHRLLSSVENTPQAQPIETRNRTLQLFKLSNSGGGDHVDSEQLLPVREPPKLMAHWEQQVADSNIQASPPLLIPHWDQSTSLPDSIMTHWQQMSVNSVKTSDKIMFDCEDTSYEIVFPSTGEEDTRASSICAPFDYPHLVDDSKSCFNSVFVLGSHVTNPNGS